MNRLEKPLPCIPFIRTYVECFDLFVSVACAPACQKLIESAAVMLDCM